MVVRDETGVPAFVRQEPRVVGVPVFPMEAEVAGVSLCAMDVVCRRLNLVVLHSLTVDKHIYCSKTHVN